MAYGSRAVNGQNSQLIKLTWHELRGALEGVAARLVAQR
jgi:hypothetical protein